MGYLLFNNTIVFTLIKEKNDILGLGDIKLLVDTFYGKVREDNLIGPIFNQRVQDRWPEHLAKMYAFWQTVLLGEHTYYGSPFPPHVQLPVEHHHFQRWLSLFSETLNELFTGEKAKEAIWRADKMAQMFEYKIEHYKNNPMKNLV